MDEKLRFLLRRYAETGNPQDAVEYANSVLRTVQLEHDAIWVVDVVFLDSETGSDISLYYTEWGALTAAAERLIAALIEPMELQIGDPESIIENIEDLLTDEKNKEELHQLIDSINDLQQEYPDTMRIYVYSIVVS